MFIKFEHKGSTTILPVGTEYSMYDLIYDIVSLKPQYG